MELAEVLLLVGTQKLYPVETRLGMEVGGAARQGLRLGKWYSVCVCVCVCVCVSMHIYRKYD